LAEIDENLQISYMKKCQFMPFSRISEVVILFCKSRPVEFTFDKQVCGEGHDAGFDCPKRICRTFSLQKRLEERASPKFCFELILWTDCSFKGCRQSSNLSVSRLNDLWEMISPKSSNQNTQIMLGSEETLYFSIS
jgi:hypothetical protein